MYHWHRYVDGRSCNMQASNAYVCGDGYYKDIKNQPVYKVRDLKQ